MHSSRLQPYRASNAVYVHSSFTVSGQIKNGSFDDAPPFPTRFCFSVCINDWFYSTWMNVPPFPQCGTAYAVPGAFHTHSRRGIAAGCVATPWSCRSDSREDLTSAKTRPHRDIRGAVVQDLQVFSVIRIDLSPFNAHDTGRLPSHPACGKSTAPHGWHPTVRRMCPHDDDNGIPLFRARGGKRDCLEM